METESHHAITSGNVSANVVSVLLKFEIMEVRQQVYVSSHVLWKIEGFMLKQDLFCCVGSADTE